uniref:Retrotransposon protein, putative, Ty3-gypsy subclass n=1 Tax=Oryza sativa subsp. japonica TaxID=39947 RepID=Q6ATA8_ORYSJ|nr:hypothetical protein [Oryza sativa Japonica Group]
MAPIWLAMWGVEGEREVDSNANPSHFWAGARAGRGGGGAATWAQGAGEAQEAGKVGSVGSGGFGGDRSVHDRLTGEGDDDVDDDVTTGGGGSAARTAHAHRRTAALWHELRTPTGSGRHGELTGDQSDGGRPTDGDGDEVETAALFGMTTATMLRRSPTVAKRRTRTATTWRARRRSSRATTMTGTAAAHGWSDGGDGGARAHGARALRATRGEGEGGGR